MVSSDWQAIFSGSDAVQKSSLLKYPIQLFTEGMESQHERDTVGRSKRLLPFDIIRQWDDGFELYWKTLVYSDIRSWLSTLTSCSLPRNANFQIRIDHCRSSDPTYRFELGIVESHFRLRFAHCAVNGNDKLWGAKILRTPWFRPS